MQKSLKPYLFALTMLGASAGMLLPAHAALPFFSDDKEAVPSLAPMLEEATPAVVSISVVGSNEVRRRVPDVFRYFFGPNVPNEQVEERPFQGLGSGVIIDAKEGYIVTNYHVVENADTITITLKDGRELEAKNLGSDPQSDIALLQVKPENLTALKIANSDKLRVGDFVVAIGNPFGFTQTVTSGIVSALGRGGLSLTNYQDFIQTDAAINRGNSGGALVNWKGELVGINTAVYGPNGANVGIGFAIPSNMMKNLVDQIVKFGEIRRGLLGIRGGDVDSELAESTGLSVAKGIVVNEVVEDQAADKAGIEAGDIITAINGNKLESFQELRAKVSSLGGGAEIKLTILRDGKEKQVNVTLGVAETQSIVEAQELHPGLEGATLVNGETEKGEKGVEVTELEEGSNALRSGLEKGDIIVAVNRTRITSVKELDTYLSAREGVIALNVKRGNRSLYLVIR